MGTIAWLDGGCVVCYFSAYWAAVDAEVCFILVESLLCLTDEICARLASIESIGAIC